MSLFKNKTTIALILIMCAIAFTGLLISYIYYKNLNESIDPRIVEARSLYEKYNDYTQSNDFDAIFLLMDSVEEIYKSVDHYKDSYETGVLYNNRAASFLTMAIYSNDLDSISQDSLFSLAEISANKSANIYLDWLDKFQNLNEKEIRNLISFEFYSGLEQYDSNKKTKFLKSRLKEIQDSQTETKRRLSVTYTNLGIIYRHKLQYELAANSYKEALDLWDKNLTAENNLNVLLGRPIKKRSVIQKMFPEERK